MADLPAEAVQAAAAAMDLHMDPADIHEPGWLCCARAALDGAAPILAAQVRREERLRAMKVVLCAFSMPGAETHPDVASAVREIGEAP